VCSITELANTILINSVYRLTLGGGFGWLSGSYGLVIDNLVQVRRTDSPSHIYISSLNYISYKATVVTADSSVLTASDTENSDLFFGIRGGGVNFGVVTEFVLKLHDQRPTVYAGWLPFEPSKLEKLLSITDEWFTTIHEKAGMCMFLGSAPDGLGTVCPSSII
jgi:FAD/FMN-containing dehydrogenase